MYGRGGAPWATMAGLLALVTVVVFAPCTVQQTDGVARIELCQPNRVLPSYLQDACNELLASRGTEQSAMADSGTGASPPDRRPLSDPPRYGRRSGGSAPLSVHVSKRLYSLPTVQLYNVMNRRRHQGVDRGVVRRRALIGQSFDLLRKIAPLRAKFNLLENM